MSARERAVRMRAVLPLCTYVLGYCFGSLLLVEHDLAAWNSRLSALTGIDIAARTEKIMMEALG